MAENKYGVSDPAITVDPITARHPFGIFNLFTNYIYIICLHNMSR